MLDRIKADIENIKNEQSKSYFREVVSSYENENYRSAIVVLYILCLSDLLYKLKEVADVDEDERAKKIIADVMQKQQEGKNWEFELATQMHNKAHLLDETSWKLLNHMREMRNACAHPSYDNDWNLIQPCQEQVLAQMRFALDNILLKPAFYIDDVVDKLSDDLAAKKSYLLYPDTLDKYLKRRYLRHLSNELFVRVFGSFWKFVFRLNNDDCNANRDINMLLLDLMYKEREDVINSYIDKNPDKFAIEDHLLFWRQAHIFFGQNPSLYGHLSEITRKMHESNLPRVSNGSLLRWYLKGNKVDHINYLIEREYWAEPSNADYRDFIQAYREEGLLSYACHYLILAMQHAISFMIAIEYFNRIRLMINEMTEENIYQFYEMASCDNPQIRNCQYMPGFCEEVFERCNELNISKQDIKNRYPDVPL